MGFYNIMLEGEQAEAYKARKAKEAEEKEKAEAERVARRNYNYGNAIDDIGNSDKSKIAKSNALKKYSDISHKAINDVFDAGKDKDKAEKDAIEATAKSDKDNKGLGRFTAKGKASKNAADEANKRFDDTKSKLDSAMDRQQKISNSRVNDIDAIQKHMKRHPEQWDGSKYIGPKKESGIFESVEFLN